MKVLIGIVAYGGLPFLKILLASIKETVTKPADILAISAKPGDDEMVGYLLFEEKNDIFHISHGRNMGFPASINDLYDAAFIVGDYDALIILGNDTVMLPGSLDAMIHCAETTDWDMVCGSEFNSKFLVSAYPEARQYFHGDNLVFNDFSARPWELHKHTGTGIEPHCRKDIRNFALFKRSCFEKAGFADVNYWPNGYYEDLDMFVRLERTGATACGLQDAPFFHFWSRTIHQGDARPNDVYFQRNEAYYHRKWGGGWLKETFPTPFNMGNSTLREGLHLPRTLKIESRDQEADIISYWSSL